MTWSCRRLVQYNDLLAVVQTAFNKLITDLTVKPLSPLGLQRLMCLHLRWITHQVHAMSVLAAHCQQKIKRKEYVVVMDTVLITAHVSAMKVGAINISMLVIIKYLYMYIYLHHQKVSTSLTTMWPVLTCPVTLYSYVLLKITPAPG